MFEGISGKGGAASKLQPVVSSGELRRILDLPRRELTEDPELIESITNYFKRPGGEFETRWIQATSLYEAALANGLFGMVGVGWGKCVREGTELFDPDSGRRAVENLGGFKVPSFKEGKIDLHQAISVLSGEKECMRLLLHDGQQIEASVDHPIMTQRGWVEIRDLLPEDLVATARSIPEPTTPSKLSDDEIKLSAYLLADGGLSQAMVTFSDDNPAILSECVDLADSLCKGVTYKKERSNATDFYIKGGRAFVTRVGLGTYLSKNKRVPSSFYLFDKEQVALFLNRFWACDGNISEDVAECTLASELLIKDLQWFLKRLGIRSRTVFKIAKCGEKYFDAWRLSFSGSDYLRFLETVGPIKGQEDKHKGILSRLRIRRRNTNVDIVPVNRKVLMKSICGEMGIPAKGDKQSRRTKIRSFTGATDKQYLSRENFASFCEEFGYTGELAWYANSDVCWERIRSIEPVGRHPVYDLSVPSAGNFVANGIVIHNTLITLLMPTAMDSKRAVLLLPSQLMKKTLKEIDTVYNKHFKIPLQKLHIHSYEQLSTAKTGDLLEEIQPDLIILDEAHHLKNPSTARGKRFKRYMDSNPGCRLVALSGTMITRKITECAYLCEYALGKGSPLPRGYNELRDWGGALDVKPDEPKAPGALKKFCAEGETPRQGFWRRLAQTQGVIMTQSEGFEGTILMQQRKPEIPESILELRKQTTKTWEIGDKVITEATEFARVMSQLAQGHYLRWDWPNGPDEEWLELKRTWNKELQHFLRYRSKAGLDSGLLVTNAVKRGEVKGDIQAAWHAWSKVKHRPEPKTVPVWVDDFLVQDAIAWGKKQKKRAIIWVDRSLAVEQAFRDAGLPVYGSGDDANDAREPVIVCGVRSQGTGKNLQYHYHKNLFFTMLSNGGVLEQTMGRTHRDQQPEGEVEFYWNGHTEEMHRAFASAEEDARFAQEGGQRQKFLLARHI